MKGYRIMRVGYGLKNATATLEHAEARFTIQSKAEEKRQFTGLASTWDLDQGGDVIQKGAYTRTLREWKANERLVPLMNQHRYSDALDVIGKMVSARQTDAGLETTFQVVASPKGDEFLARIREGMLDGLSIGYETRGWREPTDDEKKRGVWRVLTDVELKEVSVVIWGMNANALIDASSVKALAASLAGMKRGKLTDEQKEELRGIQSKCAFLLSDAPDDDPASQDPPSDPAGGKTGVADDGDFHYRQSIQALRIDRVLRAGRRTLTH